MEQIQGFGKTEKRKGQTDGARKKKAIEEASDDGLKTTTARAKRSKSKFGFRLEKKERKVV